MMVQTNPGFFIHLDENFRRHSDSFKDILKTVPMALSRHSEDQLSLIPFCIKIC